LDKGPVRLPDGTFLNPARKQADLIIVERLAGLDWRHAIVQVLCGNTLDERARFRMAGHNRKVVGLEFGERAFFEIEPQSRLSFAGMRPMARVAVMREEWGNVLIEIKLRGVGWRRGGQQEG